MKYLNDISYKDCVGKVCKSLNSGDFKIVKYNDNRNVEVQFLKTGYEATVEAVINRVKEVKDCQNTLITSCYKEINSQSADDPNLVKVVINNLEEAIYFSRAKIPYHRDGDENSTYFGHLGIYGFTKKSLNKFCSLNSSKLENIEKLEQLRAIDNGFKIAMVKVNSKSFGIDTKEDLEKALKIFSK